MDINAKLKVGFIVVVLFVSMLLMNSLPFVKSSEYSINNSLQLSADDGVVVDKVYNFTVGDSQLDFSGNIHFEKHYYYQITVGVVTPHTCDMEITIWDPEGDQFIITSEYNLTQDDYRKIPFGTVLEGNYSIRFDAVVSQNLNIHIKIEQGEMCLYDKIDHNERQYIKYYNVTKFYNGMTIEFTLDFRTDLYYKFYFERVSTISITLSNYVVFDHGILDPQGLIFQIYQDEPLGYVDYWFGTAVDGLCTMNIVLNCDVDCVNIAYAVVEKEEITDIIDPNDPQPPPVDPPVNNTNTGIEAFIPFEGTLMVMVGIGAAVCIPCGIVLYRRKRNTSGI